MRPSPEVNDRILGIIGRAQRLTEVRIFSFNYQSNHSHDLDRGRFRQADGRLPTNPQSEPRQRARWPLRLETDVLGAADTTPPVSPRMSSTNRRRLRYILANGCKDGLVDSPLDWPGVSTAWALSRGIWKLQGHLARPLGGALGTGQAGASSRSKRPLSSVPFPSWNIGRARSNELGFATSLRDIEQRGS